MPFVRENAVLDFGAAPGSPMATTIVTTPRAALAVRGYPITVRVVPVDSPDHSADESMLEPITYSGRVLVDGYSVQLDGFAQDRPLPASGIPSLPYGKFIVEWSA